MTSPHNNIRSGKICRVDTNTMHIPESALNRTGCSFTLSFVGRDWVITYKSYGMSPRIGDSTTLDDRDITFDSNNLGHFGEGCSVAEICCRGILWVLQAQERWVLKKKKRKKDLRCKRSSISGISRVDRFLVPFVKPFNYKTRQVMREQFHRHVLPVSITVLVKQHSLSFSSCWPTLQSLFSTDREIRGLRLLAMSHQALYRLWPRFYFRTAGTPWFTRLDNSVGWLPCAYQLLYHLPRWRPINTEVIHLILRPSAIPALLASVTALCLSSFAVLPFGRENCWNMYLRHTIWPIRGIL